MKFIVFALLALAATATAAPTVGGELADLLSSLLSYVQEVIPEDADLSTKEGELSLPENDVENGVISVNEVSLTGLKSVKYTVAEGDTEAHVDYSLEIEDLVALIDINLNLTGLLDVQHGIVIRVDLQKLTLSGDVELNEDGSQLSDFDILLALEGSAIDVEGVIDEEFSKNLSADLTEKVVAVVNEITEGIEKPVSGIIKYAINLILTILS